MMVLEREGRVTVVVSVSASVVGVLGVGGERTFRLLLLLLDEVLVGLLLSLCELLLELGLSGVRGGSVGWRAREVHESRRVHVGRREGVVVVVVSIVVVVVVESVELVLLVLGELLLEVEDLFGSRRSASAERREC